MASTVAVNALLEKHQHMPLLTLLFSALEAAAALRPHAGLSQA
jgi:hypothetical protein